MLQAMRSRIVVFAIILCALLPAAGASAAAGDLDLTSGAATVGWRGFPSASAVKGVRSRCSLTAGSSPRFASAMTSASSG